MPAIDTPFGREALERNAPVDGVSNYSNNETQTSSPIAAAALTNSEPLEIGQSWNFPVIRTEYLREEVRDAFLSNPTHPMAPGIRASMQRSTRHAKRPDESMAEYEARLHSEIPDHGAAHLPASLQSNASFHGAGSDELSQDFSYPEYHHEERHDQHRNTSFGQSSSQTYTTVSPSIRSPLLSPTTRGLTDDVPHLSLAAVSNGDNSSSTDLSSFVPGASLENHSSGNLSYSVGDEIESFSVRRLNGSSPDLQVVRRSSVDSIYSIQLDGDAINQSVPFEQYNSELNANQQAYLDQEFSMEDYERGDYEEDDFPEDDFPEDGYPEDDYPEDDVNYTSTNIPATVPATIPAGVSPAVCASNEDEIDDFEAGMIEAIDCSLNESSASTRARAELTDDTQVFAGSSLNSMNTGESSTYRTLSTPRSVDDLERGTGGVTMVSLAEARTHINRWLATKYPSSPSGIQQLSSSADPDMRLERLKMLQGVLRYGFDEYRQTSEGKIYKQTLECKEMIDSIRHRVFVTVRNVENGSSQSSIYEDPIWAHIERKILHVHRLWGRTWADEEPELLTELLRDGF